MTVQPQIRIAWAMAAMAGIAALALTAVSAAQQPSTVTAGVPGASPTTASRTAASPATRAQQAYVQTLAAYLLDHNRQKAEQGFSGVTQIDPGYAPAWFNLGVFAEGDKDWTKASRCFEAYLRAAPNGPDAGRAKGQLQVLAKYASGAITPEQERRERYDATIQRARAFLAAGLYRESIAEAGRAESADGSRWEAYAVVALCMARQHKHDEAVKFETLAVNHAPADKHDAVQTALASEIARSVPAH